MAKYYYQFEIAMLQAFPNAVAAAAAAAVVAAAVAAAVAATVVAVAATAAVENCSYHSVGTFQWRIPID